MFVVDTGNCTLVIAWVCVDINRTGMQRALLIFHTYILEHNHVLLLIIILILYLWFQFALFTMAVVIEIYLINI